MLSLEEIAKLPQRVQKIESAVTKIDSFSERLDELKALKKEIKDLLTEVRELSTQNKAALATEREKFLDTSRESVGAQVESLVRQFRLDQANDKIWSELASLRQFQKQTGERLQALEERVKQSEEIALKFDDFRKFKMFWEEEQHT